MDYVFWASVQPEPLGGFVVSFPDVPEALTQGEDLADAKRSAAEALGQALRWRLADGQALPEPATKGGGLVAIPVEADDALKLAVIDAFRNSGLSKSELARRLGKAETEAYRIIDPDHPTKLASLQAALAVLGKEIVVSVKDAP